MNPQDPAKSPFGKFAFSGPLRTRPPYRGEALFASLWLAALKDFDANGCGRIVGSVLGEPGLRAPVLVKINGLTTRPIYNQRSALSRGQRFRDSVQCYRRAEQRLAKKVNREKCPSIMALYSPVPPWPSLDPACGHFPVPVSLYDCGVIALAMAFALRSKC